MKLVWAGVTKKEKNLQHIIHKCDPLAIAPPIPQGAGAVPSLYSHMAQCQDLDSDNIPKPFKVQKAEEERNEVKANRNLKSSLNHLPIPQKKKNIMKRQITIMIMRIIEAITEATNPAGVNKVVAENLIEVINKGEGDSKTIIGANTKATMDNLTPPMETITITIITVIIEAEVDMAVVVIIREVMAVDEAIIEAITITNTTNTTDMMMVHRWNNMAHHVNFVMVLITLLSIVSKESMT